MWKGGGISGHKFPMGVRELLEMGYSSEQAGRRGEWLERGLF